MKTNIWNDIQKGIKFAGRFIDKHSTEILVGCGIVGFVSTTILVAKEAPVAEAKLDELHMELAEVDEELPKSKIIFEEIKTVAPVYAPAVLTGVVSIGCILGSYKIASGRTAALATAYEFTQASFNEYRNKVVQEMGEKKEKKVRDEIAQDKVSKNPPSPTISGAGEVIMTDGLSLFYDSASGRYFRSSVELIRKAEKTISDRLFSEDYVSLNELYYELGMTETRLGDAVGFNIGDGITIIFNSCVAPDMTPCMVMDYLVAPRLDYDGSRRYRY